METEKGRRVQNCSSDSIDVSLDGLDISSVERDSSAGSFPEDSEKGLNLVEREGSRLSQDEDRLELGPTTADIQGNGIANLLQRTGCSIVQDKGQRLFGPPPDWEGPAPQRGCEVFVGKIPSDCYEDELVPVFGKIGKIYKMRLKLERYSGQNRGYCFVEYSTASEAKDCVRILNNYEIRKGRFLGVCMSVDNCRLFIGGIPKKLTKEDIVSEMQKVTEGVDDVIVYPSASDKTKNRGFAFVIYQSHHAAAMARKKLIKDRIDLWGHTAAVDWAEPELEVDTVIMDQVKILYVRNLMLSTTEAHILEVFSAYGTVERVKKIRDYAFVHFQSKEEAHKAIKAVNGTMLDGAWVEVTLAKPLVSTHMRSPKTSAKTFSVPACYEPVDQYGTMCISPTGYISPPSTQHRFMRNSMGAYMLPNSPTLTKPANPMILPPTSPPRMSTICSPFYQSSTLGTKRLTEQEFRLAADPPVRGAHPGPAIGPMLEVVPVATLSTAPPTESTATKSSKSSPMLLEELCQKNNWSDPVYSLHTSASSVASGGGESETLFFYKVVIALTFVPPMMSTTVAEAKEIAAELTLLQLESVEAAITTTPSVPPPGGPELLHPGIVYSPANYVAYPTPAQPPVCLWPPQRSWTPQSQVCSWTPQSQVCSWPPLQPLSPMDNSPPSYYNNPSPFFYQYNSLN